MAGTQAGATPLQAQVESYYSDRVRRFGATPLGVDWTCRPTQELRFVKLLQGCDLSQPCSINDIGCGYGALARFIARRHPGLDVDYLGIDLSREMILRARRSRAAVPAHCRFETGAAAPRVADYSLASGVFNVCLDTPRAAWEAYARETVAQIAASSRRGFAVNFISAGAAAHRAGLYAADPGEWASFCRQETGMEISVISGYGMPEFTLAGLR